MIIYLLYLLYAKNLDIICSLIFVIFNVLVIWIRITVQKFFHCIGKLGELLVICTGIIVFIFKFLLCPYFFVPNCFIFSALFHCFIVLSALVVYLLHFRVTLQEILGPTQTAVEWWECWYTFCKMANNPQSQQFLIFKMVFHKPYYLHLLLLG